MTAERNDVVLAGLSAVFGLALVVSIAARVQDYPVYTWAEWLIVLLILNGLAIGLVYSSSIVPKLEALVQQLIGEEANDDATRARIISELKSLPAQLEQSLGSLLVRVQEEKDFYKRVHCGAEIRRLWRGI